MCMNSSSKYIQIEEYIQYCDYIFKQASHQILTYLTADEYVYYVDTLMLIKLHVQLHNQQAYLVKRRYI
jgi:beta-glucosidase/6-phospho-beta-glucosidase/beta-galactosidase